MNNDEKTPQRLPRDQAEDILRRAIVIDEKKSATLSLDEIRSIALELGVSAESVELALQSRSKEPAVAETVVEEPKSWWYAIGFFLFGAMMVVTSDISGLHLRSAILLTNALVLLFAFAQRGSDRYRRTVKAALAIWLGITIAVMMHDGGRLEVGIPAINFAISGMVGALAIVCRDLFKRKSGTTTPPSSGDYHDHHSERPSLWLRTLKKISGWLGEGPMQRALLRLAAQA